MLPAWCKKVVVVADAAYPSRANLQAIQARGWFFEIDGEALAAHPLPLRSANSSVMVG